MSWLERAKIAFDRLSGRELRRIEDILKILKLGEKHGVQVPVNYLVDKRISADIAREVFSQKLEEHMAKERKAARHAALSGYDRNSKAQRLRKKFKIVGVDNE